MSEHDWGGEDRRLNLESRSAFDRAVTVAAELAAQNIAQIHRRRLVKQTGLAAFVAALVVMLPFAYGFYRSAVDQAKQDALTNCQSQAAGRVSSDRFRFAVREDLSFIPALVAASIAKAPHHKLDKASAAFLASQVKALNENLAIERRTIPGLPAHINGYGDLTPLMADTPLIKCGHVVH